MLTLRTLLWVEPRKVWSMSCIASRPQLWWEPRVVEQISAKF